MSHLGKLEELPLSYRDRLPENNLLPLWPSLRAFLPFGIPERNCDPMIWRYDDIRLDALDLPLIDNVEISWSESDTMAILTNAKVKIRNASSRKTAYLFLVDDAPMQRKLGFYEEFK